MHQIYEAFCLMALNSLKTENDINDLKVKAAAAKNKNAKAKNTIFMDTAVHNIAGVRVIVRNTNVISCAVKGL